MADFQSPQSMPPRLWIGAALGALLLHAGCIAFAAANLRNDEDDGELGAPGIEIGLEMIAPRIDPSDLPPGPEAEASAASPAVAEQKEVVEETQRPQAVPDETPEPDRVVSLVDSKTPKEEPVETPAPAATASTESIAAEATAAPSVPEAREGPTSVVVDQGIGESMRRMRETWQKELVARLNKNKRYPGNRTHGGAELVVSFELDRTGHVLSAAIAKSSGDASFDEAALGMVRRSDPLPAPPPLVADEGLSFTLPVIFRSKDRR